MAKVYVVSRGVQEAKAWAQRYGIPIDEVVYVQGPQTFRGTRDPLVAYVGSYLSRNDLPEIREMLQYIKNKVL